MRLISVLALAIAPRVGAFGPTPKPVVRTPFAFDVSGGGLRTMRAGMAFARAMSQTFEQAPGSWEDVTHLSGNSGGLVVCDAVCLQPLVHIRTHAITVPLAPRDNGWLGPRLRKERRGA